MADTQHYVKFNCTIEYGEDNGGAFEKKYEDVREATWQSMADAPAVLLQEQIKDAINQLNNGLVALGYAKVGLAETGKPNK